MASLSKCPFLLLPVQFIGTVVGCKVQVNPSAGHLNHTIHLLRIEAIALVPFA